MGSVVWARIRGRAAAIILLGVIPFMVGVANAQQVQVARVEPNPSAEAAGPMQWRVDTGVVYQNPFDPSEVTVDGVFTGPGGKTLTLPAYWDEPGGEKSGAFYLRFAATEPGDWNLVAVVKDGKGTRQSAGQKFHNDQAQSGFVRRAGNGRYFELDSGSSYFPVGLNLAWGPTGSGAEWFDSQFATLAQNGGNFARVWMCYPPYMIESSKSGLGRYDLKNAAMFDAVLEAAQRHGIKVMLCFMNHRELLDSDMWGAAGWPKWPYNARNGGPATRPVDFFSDPRCRRFFKSHLRYIVARYGAYTSLGFWEIFNEEEQARVPISVDWNAQMSAYLRRTDPYKHLITTSATLGEDVWKLPEMDVTQSHLYGDGTQIDVVSPAVSAARWHRQFGKPHLIGEMGISYKGPDTPFDPTGKGTSFHNGLWAGLISGNAGTAMYWWWDNYVAPKNLWHEFKPVATFASEVDWAHADFEPVRLVGPWREKSEGGDVDLVLPASGGWGTTTREEVVVPENGRPEVSLAAYLYGPVHADLKSPLNIQIDLPRQTQMVLHVSRISDYAMVRASVDGKPAMDFGLSALPGAAGVTHSDYREENHVYQSDVNSELALTIPAGKHKIKFDVMAGDWIMVNNITFAGALAAKYANLGALALQDQAKGQTLAWVFDTRSNWKDDQADNSPPAEETVRIGIPNLANGNYKADWFDTRVGKIIQSEKVLATAADSGNLTLSVPTFTRDIALRLTPNRSK